MKRSPHRGKRWHQRKQARDIEARRRWMKRHPIAGALLRDSVISTGTIGSMLFVRCADRLVVMHEEWI